MDLLIEWFVDAHAHASQHGLGYGEVVKRFRTSGGKLIALVQLDPASYGFENSLEGVTKSLETHARLCGGVKREYGGVICIGGIHPATADRVVRSTKDVSRVLRLLEGGYMRKLEEMLKDGVLEGLGEFGRPHYPSPPESWAVNELLLVEGLSIAKENDAPIHIHSENAGLVTFKSIKFFVDRVGIPREKVLMHHVPPSQVSIYISEGFYVSVVGKSQVIGELGRGCQNVLVESDYLDDPRRPGAVMYPWELRREVLTAVYEGNFSAECAEMVLQENPVKYYRISV